MSVSMMAALSWLFTYAVHATLLGLAAWLIAGRVRSMRVREIIWRTALFGGMFTATAQAALELEPSWGRWSVAGMELTDSGASAVMEPGTSPAPDELATTAFVLGDDAANRAANAAAPIDWATWTLRSWALVGTGLVALAVGALGTLRRNLAGRRRLVYGPLVDQVEGLRTRAGMRRRVRISVSPSLDAPIALGVLRPEICVPPRALHLPAPLAEGMLAHEMAHLVRLDPLWLGMARAVETVFFFQPFHRLARKRLSECAEFLCDDWAVGHTGDRVGLARCLAEVAAWIVGDARPVPACAMAERRSPLGERVERILDEERTEERAPGWAPPMGAAALCATIWLAPGFAQSAQASTPSTIEPEATAAEDSATDPFGWDELWREIALLEREVAGLSSEAADRRLVPGTLERLQRVEDRIASMREKEGWIRTLLAQLDGVEASPETDH